MEIYCVSCKKYTANENSNDRKNKQNRLIRLSHCTVCYKKKAALIKTKKSTIFINLK